MTTTYQHPYTIITNNHWRDVVYGFELTESEREEFDYIDFEDEGATARFVRYDGELYDLGDVLVAPQDLAELGWQGYISYSYFFGLAFRYSEDFEQVMVGRISWD